MISTNEGRSVLHRAAKKLADSEMMKFLLKHVAETIMKEIH